MKVHRFVIGLAAGLTAGFGALTLLPLDHTTLDFSPFLYVAAASIVLAAAAGLWHLILVRRGRR